MERVDNPLIPHIATIKINDVPKCFMKIDYIQSSDEY